MAYIRRIRIEKYRSIEALDVDLAPAGDEAFRHLILTGPNGSGKSSALELIAQHVYARGVSPTPPRRGDDPFIEVELDESPESFSAKFHDADNLVVFFRAHRHLALATVSGPSTLAWSQEIVAPFERASRRAMQYLVNRKTDEAFAIANGDTAAATAIESWFRELQEHLRTIFEDRGLTLRFNRPQYTFTLRGSDGREVSFEQLADGHSAVLEIFLELLMRVEARREARGKSADAIEGIVFIDEAEAHLHLRLQELILPFLTELFPALQFIVATHSPAVIASIPGALVYDLASRRAELSEDLRGIRYGRLMTDHFGISSDMDLDSTRKLARLRTLARQATRTAEEQHELDALAELLNERSPTLRLEVWRELHPGPERRGDEVSR